MDRRLIAIALAYFASATAAHAGPPTAVDRTATAQCQIGGFLKQSNHSGADIRNAPRPGADVFAHLPPPAALKPGTLEPTMLGAEFDILGSHRGWLLIRNAEARHGDAVRRVFAGPGWISGGLVAVRIGSRKLRAGPSNDARVVAALSGKTKDGRSYGPGNFDVLTVDGCRGRFAEVTIKLSRQFDPDAKPLHGWAGRVCRHQLGPCGPR